MTASSDRGNRICPSLKGAALWIVAAVMLVFHGVAAGVVPAPLPVSGSGSDLGTISGIQPGALPREAPEFRGSAAWQKVGPTQWLADGPPVALAAEHTQPSGAVVRLAAVLPRDDVGSRASSSPFQARAPPFLSL